MPDPLTADERDLVAVATALLEARAGGDLHTVAAAVRAANGRVATGLNLHHFSGGPCAEVVALANAAADGLDELDRIVAVGDAGRGVLAPCGRCRQVLLDLHPRIHVVVPVEDGLAAVPVADLLPWAYRPRDGA